MSCVRRQWVKIDSSHSNTLSFSLYFIIKLNYLKRENGTLWIPVFNLSVCPERSHAFRQLLWSFCQEERIESGELGSRSKVKGVDLAVCSVATKRGLFL